MKGLNCGHSDPGAGGAGVVIGVVLGAFVVVLRVIRVVRRVGGVVVSSYLSSGEKHLNVRTPITQEPNKSAVPTSIQRVSTSEMNWNS